MTTYLEDRQSIADLMAGWLHRDLSEWDALRNLFHPDGTIEISWFEGKFDEFVDASMRMGVSDLKSKHIIASPTVKFNGDKALVETSAIIIIENLRLGLGCNCSNRFYDQVEKRENKWKILKRQTIYDTGFFTFPRGAINIDTEVLDRYPYQYAPMAYLLEKGGYPVSRIFATRGSDLEKTMKASGQQWLDN